MNIINGLFLSSEECIAILKQAVACYEDGKSKNEPTEEIVDRIIETVGSRNRVLQMFLFVSRQDQEFMDKYHFNGDDEVWSAWYWFGRYRKEFCTH